ncbi:MAG: acyl carrier protein [Chitinivibrionales bacterium]|nr:acyl carrier protein [Chitinivibrionales bacterium]
MGLSENEIKIAIRRFLETNFFLPNNAAGVLDNDSFLEKGIVDSTGILELIGFIQDEYKFEVVDAEILPENMDSIAHLTAYILKKARGIPKES